ncbi:MAG: hypothetical protein NT007_16200 [Candidatus Kapabacteria bacterium]|nr:hypothetical protein [Candidatus Kapabacteria bacterium]
MIFFSEIGNDIRYTFVEAGSEPATTAIIKLVFFSIELSGLNRTIPEKVKMTVIPANQLV